MNKKSVIPVLAALVAFLSVSTMLRFPGLPIGMAEITVLFASFAIIRRNVFMQNVKHPLMLFWFAFIATTMIGFFVGSIRGEGAIHTAIAYLYTAGFTLIALSYVGGLDQFEFQRFMRAMATIPVVLLFIPLLIFLLGSIWFSDLLEINTTYYPSRVAAWSMNPNQLALFLLPIPIWLAAISQNSHWQGWRFVKKFAFLWLFFFLGLCVRSDALLLAWCIGIPLLTMIVWRWLPNINWRFFGALIAAFILAFISFKFIFDGPGQQVFESVRAVVAERESDVIAERDLKKENTKAISGFALSFEHDAITKEIKVPLALGKSDSTFGVGMDPNKAGVRKTLWVHALEVWTLSPVFGHGPGAFSYLDNPQARQEAHNLLLDLLTQAGIAGLIIFAVLYLWLIAGAIKARDPFSLTTLIVLMIFSGAHFMLRQPVFMLYMVICAVVVKNRIFEKLDRSPGITSSGIPGISTVLKP
ncbi:O-antigen ligase family protein [Pseudomonas sp. MAG733B]|uniref:O-antigen ligase family protein n=1 Tax=Pseudomonas sp. MAG733B TaxID=3122079 RepID=UPI0030CD5BB9